MVFRRQIRKIPSRKIPSRKFPKYISAREKAEWRVNKMKNSMPEEDVISARDSLKLDWDDPIVAAKRLKTHIPRCAMAHAGKFSGTSIEILVGGVLEILGIPYRTQVAIGRYVVDFLIGDTLVLECDGAHFHGSPMAKARDNKRDNALQKQGYFIIRLPEKEIRSDSFNCVVSRFPKKQ